MANTSKVGPETYEPGSKILDSQTDRAEAFSKTFESLPPQNIVDLFMVGMRMPGPVPCLGTRADANSPFTWISYFEVHEHALRVCAFLVETLEIQQNSFVGIFSKNRPEWVIFELGCYMHSMVPVPLYDTLGPEAMDHILMQTKISVMLCEGPQHLTNLSKLKNFNQLQHIILITGKVPKRGEVGQKVWTWLEVISRSSSGAPLLLPGRSNLALLCYTSGTTGLPKGVQITHGNLIAEGAAIAAFICTYGGTHLKPGTRDDVYLSYLPLAHIFERIMHIVCFMHGMRIGFYRGDIVTLVNDMQELKPTIFCTVPRLLNRIHEKTLARANSSCIRSVFFRRALRSKIAENDAGIIRKDSFWDWLVFSKLHESTGNRVRLVIVGSAPVSEEVLQFTRAAFGCPVIVGYGQTECTGASSATLPSNPSTDNVGIPLATNIIRLEEVPEMKYFAKDGVGEVCIRGLNVTSGYFSMPEETAKTIDKDGWLHTGDIGQWTPEGFLKIVDRKKHIFKLSQGEYVAPEKIEQVYNVCQHVMQIYVHGDSLESFILAVVVPNSESAVTWARHHKVPEDITSLCANEQFKAEVLASMLLAGRVNNLRSFEQVRAIHLHPEPFSVENGLMTPSFKLMRNEVRKLFGETFKKMYSDLKQQPSVG